MSQFPANTLAILGSSRNDGNTRAALEQILPGQEVEVVDLLNLKISYFDYDQTNVEDDFISLAEKMVSYEQIILATPVYWYSMSGVMKTFLDRWSAFVTIRKDLGRALEGKQLFTVASYGGNYPIGFEIPFQLTAEYMNMRFMGSYYYYCGGDPVRLKQNNPAAESFKALIQ